VIGDPSASLGGFHATDLAEVSSDPLVLDGGGRWAVALPYSGAPVLARFRRWESTDADGTAAARWQGPPVDAWATSLDAHAYRQAVDEVRSAIEVGTVYQANLCRVMSADLPDSGAAEAAGLHALLSKGNPAPFGGYLSLPEHDVAVVSASPELFLGVRADGHRRSISSGPIKGTGRSESDLSDKDRAENIMIVDLVRNDLARITDPGSLRVPALLRVEEHPGLVHLVSVVEGDLRAGTAWPEILDATFPPGSVTGAPKSTALELIETLETARRDFYCGAFGWIDADTGEAELAVAIRTFWIRDGRLYFGTGAGITWASDPEAEWRETELKAQRLIAVASGTWNPEVS